VSIVDEKRGRKVAASIGVKIIGAAGVLVAAKRKNIIDKISPVIASMESYGYYFSEGLKAKILSLAGE